MRLIRNFATNFIKRWFSNNKILKTLTIYLKMKTIVTSVNLNLKRKNNNKQSTIILIKKSLFLDLSLNPLLLEMNTVITLWSLWTIWNTHRKSSLKRLWKKYFMHFVLVQIFRIRKTQENNMLGLLSKWINKC